jgi:hypothetical protein
MIPTMREIVRERRPFAFIHEALYGRATEPSKFVTDWRARNMRYLLEPLEVLRRMQRLAERHGVAYAAPFLVLEKICADGRVLNLGLASLRLVTTAQVNAMTDGLQGLFVISNFKYHAIGTGVGAESTGDTALGTEWAAGDYTGGVRATGNQTEGASANIYHTEGTNTKLSVGTSNVTEHGVMSQAALAGGTLFDRSVFTATPLAQGEGLLSKYEYTQNAGG